MDDVSEERIRLAQFILSLRATGLNDRRVLSAIELTPRRLFLSSLHQDQADRDIPLPIECGQSMFAPSLVAYLSASLQLNAQARVLEIGTGSGYLTAILAQVAHRVCSVDRYRTLIALAEQRLATLRLSNVDLYVLDGQKGLKQKAPFDGIVSSVAFEQQPDHLLEQLNPSGVLVAAVGRAGEGQTLIRYKRTSNGFSSETLREVRFRMLEAGEAHAL